MTWFVASWGCLSALVMCKKVCTNKRGKGKMFLLGRKSVTPRVEFSLIYKFKAVVSSYKYLISCSIVESTIRLCETGLDQDLKTLRHKILFNFIYVEGGIAIQCNPLIWNGLGPPIYPGKPYKQDSPMPIPKRTQESGAGDRTLYADNPCIWTTL